jgi:hypothetical protein
MAPQTILLGNAASLTRPSGLRILLYQEYATGQASTGLQVTLDQAIGSGRYGVTATDADGVPDALSIADFDVFIVLDQSLAPAGRLAELGQDWAALLDDFATLGGVVIVLSSASGTAEMHEFIREAELLTDAGQVTDVTFSPLYTRDLGDAVGGGVLSPFNGLYRTCVFDTMDTPGGSMSFVVTDAPESSGELGNPVVIHEVRAP